MRPLLEKLRFLVCSGPTREPLDPVRYLSNYSTGTMGRHLADAVRKSGNRLTWVRCPEDAETARELLARLRRELPKHDVLVMAAAVCDVRPLAVSVGKLKKNGLRTIRVTENPDVLKALGQMKAKRQVFVGFALESERIRENALGKLRRKNLEVILAQKVISKNTPFGDARIAATAYGADGSERSFAHATKARIAGELVRTAERLFRQKKMHAKKGRV